MKKTVKKSTKPTYTVDLTKCETPEDIRFEFIRAKATSGIAITDEDISFILAIGSQTVIDTIDSSIKNLNVKSVEITDPKKIKKLIKLIKPKNPWYKRFWRWITRKNK